MQILQSIYTDEYQSFVDKNVSKEWVRMITELSSDINSQFLNNCSLLSQEQLHIVNQQRVALQTLLTSLITNHEES